MVKTILACVAFAMASLAFAATADAHPRLLAQRPLANTIVAQPREVRLTFNEPLFGRFSSIAVRDQAGRVVMTGRPVLSRNGRQTAVALPAHMAPGRYRVIWRAVSQDTHRISGAYAFAVTR